MENIPRPPNPFSMGLGLHQLKSRVQKPFTEETFNLVELRRKSPTERMREIDSIRLFTPTATERSMFRIPQSIERLNIKLSHHIMILCGGCAGVRFSSEVHSVTRIS